MRENYPFIATCPVCNHGLIRVWLSESESRVLAICDECNAVWNDIQGAANSPHTTACEAWHIMFDPDADVRKATMEEIQLLGFGQFVEGISP